MLEGKNIGGKKYFEYCHNIGIEHNSSSNIQQILD